MIDTYIRLDSSDRQQVGDVSSCPRTSLIAKITTVVRESRDMSTEKQVRQAQRQLGRSITIRKRRHVRKPEQSIDESSATAWHLCNRISNFSISLTKWLVCGIQGRGSKFGLAGSIMLGPRSDKNRMSQYIPVYTPVGFHQVFIVTIPMLGSERGGKVHIMPPTPFQLWSQR